MPRRETEPTSRTHVFLYDSDIEWLKSTYGDNIGVARAVRMMVRGFRRKVEAKTQDVLDQESDPPLKATEPVTLEELGV
jgi:hypothetical protein